MTAAVAERPAASSMSATNVSDWEHRNELTLAAVPSAVSCARMLVRQSLVHWQFDEEFVRAVERVTNELVIHAIATTGVIETAPFYDAVFDHLGLLFVRLRLSPERVLVEVWDCGELPPHPRLEGSRIIAATEEWGYDQPSCDKRVVWCVVSAIPDPQRGKQTELPRRVPRPVPRHDEMAPGAVSPDVDLLRRVLDGLRRIGPDEWRDRC